MFYKIIQASVLTLIVNHLHVETGDVPKTKIDLKESLKNFNDFLEDIKSQIPKIDAKNKDEQNHEWTFEGYMKKFKPGTVKGNVEKHEKSQTANWTAEERFHKMYTGIDEVDDLLKLKVENGDAKVYSKDGRRTFSPLGVLAPWDRSRDPYLLKPRFVELMKQAIYQTRDRMVIMQRLRKKYRGSALYKMGFLFSKTDHTCKIFCSVAYKAFKACSLFRQNTLRRFHAYEIIEAEERLLDLWFDRDLLVDLIRYNDNVCRTMLHDVVQDRKKEFDKVFVD